MRRFSVLTLGLALLWFAPAPAQAATRLGPSCDLSVLGAHDTGGFLHFDNSLREALTARDAGAVAALVAYPLRVDADGGGYATIHDAAAFRQRAAMLLPASARPWMPSRPARCSATPMA